MNFKSFEMLIELTMNFVINIIIAYSCAIQNIFKILLKTTYKNKYDKQATYK